jgi:Rrf2 family protein
MFSQTVEYALRAMVQLASQPPSGSTTRKIASKTKVPAAYLAKVLQSMRRAGLVNSRRGVGGGVSLAWPAEQISLLDVIDALEPLKRSGARSAKGRAATAPLQRQLNAALAQVRQNLADISLGDIVKPPTKKRAPKKAKKKVRGKSVKKKAK